MNCPICDKIAIPHVGILEYEEFGFKMEATEMRCPNKKCKHIWLTSFHENQIDFKYRLFLQDKLREALATIKKLKKAKK